MNIKMLVMLAYGVWRCKNHYCFYSSNMKQTEDGPFSSIIPMPLMRKPSPAGEAQRFWTGPLARTVLVGQSEDFWLKGKTSQWRTQGFFRAQCKPQCGTPKTFRNNHNPQLFCSSIMQRGSLFQSYLFNEKTQ